MNKNITLDTYHKNKLNELDIKKNLKIYENKKKKIQKKLDILEKKKDYEISNKEIEEKYNLKLELKEIENKKNNFINNNPKYDYYLETIEILEKYYSKTQNKITINKKDKKDKKENTIFDYLNNTNDNKNVKINNFIDGEKKTLRKKIFFDYLDKIDKSNKNSDIEYVKNYTFCDKCNKEKTLITSESLYVCEICGECNSTIIESEKTSYKDNIIENYNFSYKRYNHFIEWLNQFQGLETINIPIEVYNKINKEIKKQKIDSKKINQNSLRKILKKINENKYYEHINHILNKINNRPAPKFTKSVEEQLKIMFKKCQEPFNKVCPEDRKNFLSYSYIIRKFLELINENKYIDFFPLLKSREKLYEQDLIWKKMCIILQWNFIPSI